MKKELSMRSLLNIIGLIIFLGMIFMAFTNPLTIDPSLGVYQHEKAVMRGTEIFDFSIFLLISSFIYFFLVQLYYSTDRGRKLFFFILPILVIVTPIVAIYLKGD